VGKEKFMQKFLEELNIKEKNYGAYCSNWIETKGEVLKSYSPVDGKEIASIKLATQSDYEHVVVNSVRAFNKWKLIPAPKRGEIIRQLALEFRKFKKPLANLISYEMGKIIKEAEGEVQEMIDMADFAVGLSRQLYGLTMHSERPSHRMYEQWHPLGVVGVITAFNFPTAVWSWNAFIAAVCGDTVIWKPSSKTPLCAIAVQNIINKVLDENNIPEIFSLIIGKGRDIGESLLSDGRIPLISATGSCNMGRRIAEVVGKRFGKTILELGGNNAIIVMDDADLDLAVRAITFGAIGTSGQRCTTTRRLIMHKKISGELTQRLLKIYNEIKIGNPLEEETVMGPLVDQDAVTTMEKAIETIKKQCGEIIYGGKFFKKDCYVEPVLVNAKKDLEIIKEETFAPILYLITVNNLEEAIEVQNSVPQGLSSAIFTLNLKNAETFLSNIGSDCGIANVNIGTSGAEIGGAFGGEKDTGGGREAGSDSWKAYMRRQTCTINYSNELPLAQGIKFDV
jgi:aldehyde dehydrogenase (NAD+)